MRTTLNYSPNFETIKRKPSQIKFIIFHYTGMKKESEAIKRLTDIKSKVSCHYLIKNNGEIVAMVPDLYVAWHAGVSSWKNFKSLNKHSIGIEISNPGHDYSYKKFSKKQIQSLKKLSQFLKLITCAFQRRFRQELINGKIDDECLAISQNLVKKFS